MPNSKHRNCCDLRYGVDIALGRNREEARISATGRSQGTSALPFSVASDIDLSDRLDAIVSEQQADVVITQGQVPEALDGDVKEGIAYQLLPGKLLLNIPDGTRILVRDGRQITYSRGPETSDRDLALFLMGSSWGGLCYQRGLIPIHGSGVMLNGKVVGFTGASGAGKSTLAANLSRRGLPFFTDDTIIFDPNAQSDAVFCYAGQRRMKLWGDAVELTGSEALHRVRSTEEIDKYFAEAHVLSEASSGVMTRLFVLLRARGESKHDNLMEPVQGIEAFHTIVRNLYRAHFAEVLLGREAYFASLKRLSEGMPIERFTRSVMPDNYDRSVDFIMRHMGAPASQEEA